MQIELGDEREVIASHLGDSMSTPIGTQESERPSIVDTIEPTSGRDRRVGLDRSRPISGFFVGGASKSETLDHVRSQQRAPVIEVASENTSHFGRQFRHLVRSGYQPSLPLPLAGRQAQVKVEYFQAMWMAGLFFDLDRRVLTAPALSPSDCQIDVALAKDWETTQRGIPVPTLAQTDIVAESKVVQTQRTGDLLGKVELARSWCSLVDLLKQNDIGPMVVENSDHTLGPESTIHADRAMNVVCGQSQFQ